MRRITTTAITISSLLFFSNTQASPTPEQLMPVAVGPQVDISDFAKSFDREFRRYYDAIARSKLTAKGGIPLVNRQAGDKRPSRLRAWALKKTGMDHNDKSLRYFSESSGPSRELVVRYVAENGAQKLVTMKSNGGYGMSRTLKEEYAFPTGQKLIIEHYSRKGPGPLAEEGNPQRTVTFHDGKRERTITANVDSEIKRIFEQYGEFKPVHTKKTKQFHRDLHTDPKAKPARCGLLRRVSRLRGHR
jgi:hypothetical protein